MSIYVSSDKAPARCDEAMTSPVCVAGAKGTDLGAIGLAGAAFASVANDQTASFVPMKGTPDWMKSPTESLQVGFKNAPTNGAANSQFSMAMPA